MWGCSAIGASHAETSQPTESDVVASGHSCHSKSHDCCAKKAKGSTEVRESTPSGFYLGSVAEGMMNDCPLAVTANALVSKATTDSHAYTHSAVAGFSNSTIQNYHSKSFQTPIKYLNRGPTYLRCCAFLI